jgi:hypothetical protein
LGVAQRFPYFLRSKLQEILFLIPIGISKSPCFIVQREFLFNTTTLLYIILLHYNIILAFKGGGVRVPFRYEGSGCCLCCNHHQEEADSKTANHFHFFSTFWHRLWGAASIGKDWMQALDCF